MKGKIIKRTAKKQDQEQMFVFSYNERDVDYSKVEVSFKKEHNFIKIITQTNVIINLEYLYPW